MARWSVTISHLESEANETEQNGVSPAAAAIASAQHAKRSQTQRKKRGVSIGKENSTYASSAGSSGTAEASDCDGDAAYQDDSGDYRRPDKITIQQDVDSPDKKKKRSSKGSTGQLVQATSDAHSVKSTLGAPTGAVVDVPSHGIAGAGKRGQRGRGVKTDVLASLK